MEFDINNCCQHLKSACLFFQPYATISCLVIASDNGTPRLTSSAVVRIMVLNPGDPSILPSWLNYPGTNTPIDDYKVLYVNESDSNLFLVNLTARPSTGNVAVKYFLQNDPQLQLGDQPFSYNQPGNNIMSIYMSTRVDASQKWIHNLRCRAFVSCLPTLLLRTLVFF